MKHALSRLRRNPDKSERKALARQVAIICDAAWRCIPQTRRAFHLRISMDLATYLETAKSSIIITIMYHHRVPCSCYDNTTYSLPPVYSSIHIIVI